MPFPLHFQDSHWFVAFSCPPKTSISGSAAARNARRQNRDINQVDELPAGGLGAVGPKERRKETRKAGSSQVTPSKLPAWFKGKRPGLGDPAIAGLKSMPGLACRWEEEEALRSGGVVLLT